MPGEGLFRVQIMAFISALVISAERQAASLAKMGRYRVKLVI
jgi:hypothetical protein